MLTDESQVHSVAAAAELVDAVTAGMAGGRARATRGVQAVTAAESGELRSSPGLAGHHGSEQIRRAANVLLAVIGLVLCAALMLVIAVLVKASSPGPVLYTQRRIGVDRRHGPRPVAACRREVDLGGKPFTLYKFRTMYVDADRCGEVWATADDPRVTPVGRILRKYRLDELPQLVNVLKGDMNVVGPRPEQPTIFAGLSERIHRYVDRQRVLPGITGWAQVNQHYDVSVADVQRKLAFDLEYMERRSTGEDLRIVLRTLPVMLARRGGW